MCPNELHVVAPVSAVDTDAEVIKTNFEKTQLVLKIIIGSLIEKNIFLSVDR